MEEPLRGILIDGSPYMGYMGPCLGFPNSKHIRNAVILVAAGYVMFECAYRHGGLTRIWFRSS